MVLVFLAACAPSPGELAQTYLEAVYARRVEGAHELLCSADQAAKPLVEYAKDLADPMETAADKRAQVSEPQVETLGEAAKVTLTVTKPDFHGLLIGIITDKPSEEWDAAKAKLLEDLEAGTIAATPESIAVRVHREQSKWCVYENYETRARMIALMREGDALRAEPLAAKAKYEEALALDPESVLAEVLAGAIASATERAAAKAAADAYAASSVTFSNVRVERICSACQRRILGEVKNTGDRTLTSLTLRLYGLDADAKPVFDVDNYAVSDNLITGAPEPLKANYARAFMQFAPDDAPASWTEKVEVKVESLEFE